MLIDEEGWHTSMIVSGEGEELPFHSLFFFGVTRRLFKGTVSQTSLVITHRYLF